MNCFTENDFQESRCTKQIQNLRECCKTFYNVSLVCSGMKPASTIDDEKKTVRKHHKLIYLVIILVKWPCVCVTH